MKQSLLERLCCPNCGGDFAFPSGSTGADEIREGELICGKCSRAVPIVGGIPRFVPADNYTNSFGFQWNRFARTQLDSVAGLTLSHDRLFESSGWTPENLRGKWVLDVGCGAGRFAEVTLGAGANLVALDYSSAVDACARNHGDKARANFVQADVYHLPFKPGVFDFMYCLGVLQHTPDVEGAFKALAEPLKPGGRLVVDIYPKLPLNALWPKYWLRPFTRGVESARLLRAVETMVDLLLPLSVAIGRTPLIGRKLRYAIPVANYDGIIPLSRAQLKEWAILDTFDMLAPAYDQPQTAETLQGWFNDIGFEGVEVFRHGVLVGRGMKPMAGER